MEVRIGVQYAARELVVETELDAAAVEAQLAQAVADGGVFALSDSKGKKVIVPAEKIAYIEIGAASVVTVGFRG